MDRPVEVLADLQLAVNGEDINIRGSGDHFTVDLPSLKAGRRLLALPPFVTRPWARTVGQLHDVLESAGLSADVRLNGDMVARVGSGAKPGRLSRALQLGGAEMHPTAPVRSLARRQPIATALVVLGAATLVGYWAVRVLGKS